VPVKSRAGVRLGKTTVRISIMKLRKGAGDILVGTKSIASTKVQNETEKKTIPTNFKNFLNLL